MRQLYKRQTLQAVQYSLTRQRQVQVNHIPSSGSEQVQEFFWAFVEKMYQQVVTIIPDSHVAEH